jgi:hypothetical protein
LKSKRLPLEGVIDGVIDLQSIRIRPDPDRLQIDHSIPSITPIAIDQDYARAARITMIFAEFDVYGKP